MSGPGAGAIHDRPRILIVVAAREAGPPLAELLGRIPASLDEMGEVQVLVVHGGDCDAAPELAVRLEDACRFPLTAFRDPTDPGHGGKQKLGYAYALRNGFDLVVLLPGGGEYSPKDIPRLLQPLVDGAADAALGSRLVPGAEAPRDAMPLGERWANRILTRIQNRLLGTSLSDFPCFFRAYRTSALSGIPFHYCSSARRFDIEILIQLLSKRVRFAEVPVASRHGGRISRVEGLRYARDAVASAVRFRLQRVNVLYARKFDVEGPANRHYELKLGFCSSHSLALETVPAGARVLDIGAGPGYVAAELVKKGCAVDGADEWPPEEGAPFQSFRIWHEPAELGSDVRSYDWVLLLDVVEHLRYPEDLLDELRDGAQSLEGCPRFIVTTGNVVFCVVRFQALLGSFNYGKRGILDMTHTRLYTFGTLRELFEQSGFRIDRIEGIPAPLPLVLGDNRLSRFLMRLNRLLIRFSPGLFSYQIFMVASPTPTVEALLDRSLTAPDERPGALAGLCESQAGSVGAERRGASPARRR